MSKVNMVSPALKSFKNQYLEAEKNGDKSKMSKLKGQAMQEMKKIKSEESKVTNIDGDTLDISKEWLNSKRNNSENLNLKSNEDILKK